MIRITAELIPFGLGEPKELGFIEIVNDGTGSLSVGNYNVFLKGTGGGIKRRGRVERFPRASQGVWDLLYLSLQNTLREGKKNGVGLEEPHENPKDSI